MAFEQTCSLLSACPESPVLDKKTSFSRLVKSENPQFTGVNEEFSDKRNAENGVFLPTPIIKVIISVINYIIVFMTGKPFRHSIAYVRHNSRFP